MILRMVLQNNMSKTVAMVNSEKTIREALSENGFEIGRGQISLDGSTLRPGDIDQPLDTWMLDENVEHFLYVVVKADNAAKATIVGGALVVSGSATPDQIKTLAKYRPNALKLMEGENGKKECVFAVDAGKGYGSISKFGAVFGEYTDADGKATITVEVPEGLADVKDWAIEYLGTSILNLNKVEAQFEGQLADAAEERAVIEASISVA